MPKRSTILRFIVGSVFLIGLLLIIVSSFYASTFLAMVGISIIFWSMLLLYVKPTKHVPLTLLNASATANAGNIERIINEFNFTEKGVYLPPKNLNNIDSSLVFIPKISQTDLPYLIETTEKLTTQQNGILLTPPGIALSRLFEDMQGSSFIKTNVLKLQNTLPKLLVHDLELAENIEIRLQEKTITIEVTDNVLSGICLVADNQPHAHSQVGCLLSSALACALAKATGKPITIQNETKIPENKTTVITYRIEEV